MPLPRFGNAAITWTATSETNSERVHMLEAPLRELRSGHNRQNWFRESMDQSNIEHVVLSSAGAYELAGRVRFDRNPQSLQDLLIAGSGGKPLKYYPDLKDSDISFSCDLIAPLSPNAVQMDPQRGAMGDHSVELVLRKTDQSPLEPLWYGTEVLFWYEAGGDLDAKGSTFSRTTSTSAPASFTKLPAYGNLSTAKSDEARISWESTAPSDGPRTFQTLLLEASRKNLIDESEDLAQWALENGAARTSGQSDPADGTAAWFLTSATSSAFSRIDKDITVSAATQVTVSCFVKAKGSTRSAISLETSGATQVIQLMVDWSSGIPTALSSAKLVSNENAGTTVGAEVRSQDGWWRVAARSTASLSTGTYQVKLYPTIDTSTEDALFFGVQVEN